MLVQSELVPILNDVLHQTGRLRKGGTQITFHCPKCLDKNLVTQKLEISLNGSTIGYYHCWRCGFAGKSFGSLLKKLDASYQLRQAIFKLTGDIRISKSQKRNSKTLISLPEEFRSMAEPRNTPEYKNALNYLKKRGVLYEDILRYNIGYCETGKYAFRIICPSYDAKGNLNFFVGRYYYKTEGVLPYVKADVDMNIVGFESFINYNEDITLVEGVFDAIAVRNNAAPLFGKYPSPKLREQLVLNGTKRVNMILDDDALGDAIKNCELLIRDVPNIEVHLVRLPKKDPSILGFQKIHNLIRRSIPLTFQDLLKYRLKI